MFGLPKKDARGLPQTNSIAPVGASVESNAIIFDVTTQDFETLVLGASMQTPIIVDFWAPWCGPCKQLMPTLEAVVTAAGGKVLLAKVNIDENPELAQALRVQSVPTVFGFTGGQPVDAFQGVLPESQIKAFVDKLIATARANQPDAIDVPETLKAAAIALSDGDVAGAQALYVQILTQDESNAEAYGGLIRVFIAAQDLDQARDYVENAPEDIAKHAAFNAAKTALELAQNPPADTSPLEKKVAENPDDMDAKCALAEAQFGAGQKEAAIDTLLAAVEQDREWNDAEARKSLLRFFEALGHSDPLTLAGRKKLSLILFS